MVFLYVQMLFDTVIDLHPVRHLFMVKFHSFSVSTTKSPNPYLFATAIAERA